jgi:hypothetical protein
MASLMTQRNAIQMRMISERDAAFLVFCKERLADEEKLEARCEAAEPRPQLKRIGKFTDQEWLRCQSFCR